MVDLYKTADEMLLKLLCKKYMRYKKCGRKFIKFRILLPIACEKNSCALKFLRSECANHAYSRTGVQKNNTKMQNG